MKEIALHLIDLAENSIGADANTVHISVHEDFRTDALNVSVKDDGRGMSEETVTRLSDPFFTSRTTRNIGLGIPLFKEAAETCKGSLTIQSKPGAGTCVEATFQHSHIDRMPLGDLSGTFFTLIVGHPDTHWIFTYSYTPPFRGEPRIFEFDDLAFKEVLDGFPMTHPDVLAFLRSTLQDGIAIARK